MAEATRVVCVALVQKVAQVSTMPLESIEPDQQLLAYGLGSLVAVELRNWMVGELGATVPLFELTNSAPIEALAHVVVTQSRSLYLTTLMQKEGACCNLVRAIWRDTFQFVLWLRVYHDNAENQDQKIPEMSSTISRIPFRRGRGADLYF